ncbi:putative mediator of RNA polymerase II transcription subunit 26 [Teleopsis dalmanni]|uniref:putative mediator of RNA polymerase II transcription subunit 26 n=1 Tax=Teleopsis dalmanni TaxID=139649 RepID=UPI0018CEB704|nr:putative mediator of RNA polymerase II transcription subunit 26 [Teleopsis dalmanni]XP_037930332.1 putative mediator of RNA polymerase II transcription subunit 26 [Teleopsis dalmanni]XP_037930548.1 putative mediator of RNA polymerase II transcription subunit 26 [Teleopsis dalmanni]XP_037932720.1 putative mediator of RNA polymerase II transcription subunit 26 [Teleopsis dalmanni]
MQSTQGQIYPEQHPQYSQSKERIHAQAHEVQYQQDLQRKESLQVVNRIYNTQDQVKLQLQVQDIEPQRDPQLRVEQPIILSTKLVATSSLPVPQGQTLAETSLILRSQKQDTPAQQGQEYDMSMETITRQVKVVDETPSTSQSSHQLSETRTEKVLEKRISPPEQLSQPHPRKLDCMHQNDKVNSAPNQIREWCLEIQNSGSIAMNVVQDKFFKIFKNPRKRTRNHSTR